MPADRIVYIDETGNDTYLYREYGRSKRGEKVLGIISGRKYKRTGIVAAQMGRSILEPLQYEGTMHSALFETWFESRLLPALPPKAVIVMDNASFHRKSKLFTLAEKAGHTLIFLPPYSPDLNPIEKFWSWLKRQLRKILQYCSSFDDALCSAFNSW
jgi:transposase